MKCPTKIDKDEPKIQRTTVNGYKWGLGRAYHPANITTIVSVDKLTSRDLLENLFISWLIICPM